MRASEILTEGRDANLYHAVKLQYAAQHLVNDFIPARTFHRFWRDGRRLMAYSPNDKLRAGYDDHVWIYGISTTRSVQYAASWNDVIFTFDQAKIAQRYKIIPISWGRNTKREQEEFIMLDKTTLTGDGPAIIAHSENGTKRMDNLHNLLISVQFSKRFADSYITPDFEPLKKLHDDTRGMVQTILTHPKFVQQLQ